MTRAAKLTVSSTIDALDIDMSELVSATWNYKNAEISLCIRTLRSGFTFWAFVPQFLGGSDSRKYPSVTYHLNFMYVERVEESLWTNRHGSNSALSAAPNGEEAAQSTLENLFLDIEEATDVPASKGVRRFRIVAEERVVEFGYRQANVTCADQ